MSKFENQGRLDFITSREDVIQNIKRIYNYLENGAEDQKSWAQGILRRGRVYVLEIINGQIFFAPSRFVGYKDNTYEKHTEDHGNGNETNDQLEEFYYKSDDEKINILFSNRMKDFGIDVSNKKFWIPNDFAIEDILNKYSDNEPNYWIARISFDGIWEKAVQNGYWATQQRYGHEKTSAVSNIWPKFLEIKENDILLLTYGSEIYAYGKVRRFPYDINNISSIVETITKKTHEFSQGLVKYSDSNIFYEDLRNGEDGFPERFYVGNWECFSDPSNVSTSGMSSAIVSGVTSMSLIGVTQEYGKKKVKELQKQYEQKYTMINRLTKLLKKKKNLILQGAPGTGKTYSTAALTLSTLGFTDIDLDNHEEVMKKYNALIGTQIFFVTFHQSMDYEDFVEGIKPQILTDKDGNNIGMSYEPEDGIFKKACNSVYREEDEDFSGWIEDFKKNIKGFQNKIEIPTISGKSSLYVWWNDGNTTINVRSTKSMYGDDDKTSTSPLNIQKIIDQALGKGKENNWPQYAQAVINEIQKRYNKAVEKPVVLIIDEINRGNVSKIFGELITLLEADKRDKGNHPIQLILPYSKTIFSVPSNLFIIGTMNTTDRSTGTIDYALRRRFAFHTLPSNVDMISNKVAKDLFEDIRKFIEKYRFADMDIDDLMVGHSYFMAEDDEELKLKVEYEIIPLLKEYIKDGILRVNKEEQNKYFNSWLNLEIVNDNDTGTSED